MNLVEPLEVLASTCCTYFLAGRPTGPRGIGADHGPRPAYGGSDPTARQLSTILSDLPCDFRGQSHVTLSVDLGDVGSGVAQSDLRRLQAEEPADLGRGTVP